MPRISRWLLATLIALLLPAAWAAAEPAGTASVAAAKASAAGPRIVQTIRFGELGIGGSRFLRGAGRTVQLSFGSRIDETVVAGRLHLVYAYSPVLHEAISHLNVLLNEQVVASLRLPTEGAGREQTIDIDLPARYFADYNHLRFEFIGHPTVECKDMLHPALWLSISELSELSIDSAPLALAPDLALLPAPFFDRRDGRRLELPLWLPANADRDTLDAAAVLASWFGQQAAYRGAPFPVRAPLPERHGVVFALDGALPAALGLTPAGGPMLRLIAHPERPAALLLVVQGRTGAELRQAATALSVGQVVLTGSEAAVRQVELPPARAPYDVPMWVRSDRPVKFSELVTDPQRLEVEGYHPERIKIDLRLPPDLMLWDRAGVPIDLRFRHTPPVEQNDSTLTFTVNDRLVRAFRLQPDAPPVEGIQVVVPLLADRLILGGDQFRIPSFQLGAVNQMQFRFVHSREIQGLCADSAEAASRAAIDAESTLDLTGFPHYVRMPDLGLFAASGWPFSRQADLARSALVLPDAPTPAELTAAFDVVGHLAAQTGVAATRLRVVPESAVAEVADRDLLLIGGGRGGGLLARWADSAAIRLDGVRHDAGPLGVQESLPPELVYGGPLPVVGAALGVDSPGPLAGLIAFESPLQRGRSVVAITATDDAGREAVAVRLLDPAEVAEIRGDTVVFRPDATDRFRAQAGYFIGALPWLTALRLWLAERPWVVVLIGLAAGLLLALWLFTRLRNAAQRRLDA